MVLTPLRVVGWLALLVLFVAVPDIASLSSSIQLRVLHQGVLFGLAAVGLNVLLRHTKLVSFGHAAFFGTGAYTAGVLATHFDVTSMILLLAAATLIGTLMAGVIGFLSLRHTGLYFSLLTLAFGQLLYAIAQGQSYVGGSDGISVRPGDANQATLLGADLAPDVYAVVVYYLTVLVVVVALFVMWRIVNSPFGNALDAIGQDRTRAQFIGIPVRRYVLAAFVLSGVYGALAGGMYGLVQQHVRPESTLYFLRSGEILFMAILGGFGTLIGPLVGGIVLVFLQDVGQDFTNYFDALTGLVLVLLVFGFPRGIVGSLQSGSPLRDRAGALVDDPSVAGDWVQDGADALVAALSRAKRNLVVLVFGVR
ncbi:branched-chain amino acid ABC transporter permease [Halorubellus sp. JP-L1]|nr:branched-chain amino acid ABC transporter permease [Halorubellus sp. JP-L1]NHN42479.1 branched-chain amino acid ABC transporter permease [Halorubellus sp. JP-L1]